MTDDTAALIAEMLEADRMWHASQGQKPHKTDAMVLVRRARLKLEALSQAPAPVVTDRLTLLREKNLERQLVWANGVDPGLLYHAVELGGEAGEVLNVVKKIERELRGWRGSRATTDDLAEEIADVIICADKLAACMNIDLWAAVVAKFNATSDKVGLPHKLETALTEPGQ